MVFTTLSTGFLTGAGLIIGIGAQNAFVLRQGLLRQYVGQVVTVCTLSDIALILAGVAGIGLLINEFPEALTVLHYMGALFLVVYGGMAARRVFTNTAHLSATEGSSKRSLKSVLLTCLAFTFLNPHVYLDTMILVGGLSTQHAGELRWVFAVGACVASVCWFSCLGFGARLLQPVFRNPIAWRVLDAVVAVFMMGMALLLVWYPLDN